MEFNCGHTNWLEDLFVVHTILCENTNKIKSHFKYREIKNHTSIIIFKNVTNERKF
jgi:hypothetical protein